MASVFKLLTTMQISFSQFIAQVISVLAVADFISRVSLKDYVGVISIANNFTKLQGFIDIIH
jgi:hypothetical protein